MVYMEIRRKEWNICGNTIAMDAFICMGNVRLGLLCMMTDDDVRQSGQAGIVAPVIKQGDSPLPDPTFIRVTRVISFCVHKTPPIREVYTRQRMPLKLKLEGWLLTDCHLKPISLWHAGKTTRQFGSEIYGCQKVYK